MEEEVRNPRRTNSCRDYFQTSRLYGQSENKTKQYKKKRPVLTAKTVKNSNRQSAADASLTFHDNEVQNF